MDQESVSHWNQNWLERSRKWMNKHWGKEEKIWSRILLGQKHVYFLRDRTISYKPQILLSQPSTLLFGHKSQRVYLIQTGQERRPLPGTRGSQMQGLMECCHSWCQYYSSHWYSSHPHSSYSAIHCSTMLVYSILHVTWRGPLWRACHRLSMK
jgi:hypothetical protein